MADITLSGDGDKKDVKTADIKSTDSSKSTNESTESPKIQITPAQANPIPAAKKILTAKTIELKKTDSLKSDTNPVKKPVQKAEVTSFTNIFNQQKKKTEDTNVISSVLKKEASKAGSGPILGAAPILQKSLNEEKESKLKRKLRLVQAVFVIIFFAAVASVFYFYSELNPNFDLFGINTTQRLAVVNDNLRSVQTTINAYRYKAAQLSLNRFSYASDRFLDVVNSNLTTTQTQYTQTLPSFLEDIKTQLSEDIVVPTVRSDAEDELTAEEIQKRAEDDLRNALLEERLAITSNGELTLSNEQDLELIDNTIKIVGNKLLLSTVKNASVDNFKADLETYISEPDDAKSEKLLGFISKLLASMKSGIATIGSIKSERIEWSEIIKRIEEVTKNVDPTFGSTVDAESGSSIVYTGYDFETGTNKIVLSGNTKTKTADNFTLITRLIDFFEESTYFKNVEMRSFSKSGDFETGFTSNFKLDLEIETDGSSEKNAPIALKKKAVASAIGIKRN